MHPLPLRPFPIRRSPSSIIPLRSFESFGATFASDGSSIRTDGVKPSTLSFSPSLVALRLTLHISPTRHAHVGASIPYHPHLRTVSHPSAPVSSLPRTPHPLLECLSPGSHDSPLDPRLLASHGVLSIPVSPAVSSLPPFSDSPCFFAPSLFLIYHYHHTCFSLTNSAPCSTLSFDIVSSYSYSASAPQRHTPSRHR